MFTLIVSDCDAIIAETQGFRTKQAAYEFFMLYYADCGYNMDIVDNGRKDGHASERVWS